MAEINLGFPTGFLKVTGFQSGDKFIGEFCFHQVDRTAAETGPSQPGAVAAGEFRG